MRFWLGRHRDIILAFVVFLLVSAICERHHRQIAHEKYFQWDGQYYAKMTADFQSGARPVSEAPFVYRIGVPFIASLLGREIVQSWRFLGILANVATICLLYKLLVLHLKEQWTRLILLLFFIANFKSATLGVWYAPMETDYFDKLFLVLGLIVLHDIRRRGWTLARAIFLTVVTFVGVFCREIIGVLAVSALFAHNPLVYDTEDSPIRLSAPPVIAWLPLLGTAVSFALVHSMVVPQGDYEFLETAIAWMYSKPLPDYILAWFIAFSPALVLPVYDWRHTLKYLFANQYLAVYVVAFAALGYVGGCATFRLLYWAVPAVLILVGVSLEHMADLLKRNRLFVILCSALVLVSQRVFWITPGHCGGEDRPWVFMTPLCGNPSNPLDVLGMGSLRVRILATASYVLVGTTLLVLLALGGRRPRREEKETGTMSDSTNTGSGRTPA